jgi:hypothetical protein
MSEAQTETIRGIATAAFEAWQRGDPPIFDGDDLLLAAESGWAATIVPHAVPNDVHAAADQQTSRVPQPVDEH